MRVLNSDNKSQIGAKLDKNELFSVLYNKALEGDVDCGGLISYNYFSGEPVTGFDEGAPLFVRRADNQFNLANFIFAGQSGSSMEPDSKDVEGFNQFMERYMAGLAIEHAAVDSLK